MGCIRKCERILDPVHGNGVAPAVPCSTQSLSPLALVGEESIKTCLILGSWGAEAKVVIVLPLQSGTGPSHFSGDSVGLLITHCHLFVPSASVSFVYFVFFAVHKRGPVSYSSVSEYPSVQWFQRSSLVSYLRILHQKKFHSKRK